MSNGLMNGSAFDQFFRTAFGRAEDLAFKPFRYQCRLACGEPPEAAKGDLENPDETTCQWLSRPDPDGCRSRLIDIPTGLGKTAAVVLAWLWNRVVVPSLNAQPAVYRSSQGEGGSNLNSPPWPRRLVYCLPMRTLVEQTRDEVKKWLDTLAGSPFANVDLRWLAANSPIILMGGEEADPAQAQWDLHPERPAILIGTQDMLLSRALNRGYAAGRARWPMDFALLNNDCLWAFDEVQLMGSGLATSLQLQAWRDALRLPKLATSSRIEPATFLRTCSWWMSATLAKHWFEKAVDWRSKLPPLWKQKKNEDKHLAEETRKPGRLRDLFFHTTKTGELDPVAAVPETDNLKPYCRALAEHMREHYARGGLTLIVVNNVNRAVELYKHLQGATHSSGERLFSPENIWLVHSRFRPAERSEWKDRFKLFERGAEEAPAEPRLIVATQVVEAGVDLSAKVLYTELCPFASFIQRVGRCARRPGETGNVFRIHVPDEQARPYEARGLQSAKGAITSIGADLSLGSIAAFLGDGPRKDELFPFDPLHVPQLKDLFELFDTTPDLTGADIDVSSFIRDGVDLDVQVFWREIEWESQPPNRLQPARQELCPLPVYEFTEALTELLKAGRVFRRDYREGWRQVYSPDDPHIFPGEVFLLERTCGGYSEKLGWTGNPNDPVTPCPPGATKVVTTDEDNEENEIAGSTWQSILVHTQDVASELTKILDAFDDDLTAGERKLLRLACTWHDRGKAHSRFQGKLTREARSSDEAKQSSPVAKAPDRCWKSNLRYDEDWKDEPDYRRRKGFRHELASALSLLETVRVAFPNHPALASSTAPLSFDDASAGAAHALCDLPREDFDLLLYLIAAHHGKVRLSLRASPDDYDPSQPDPVSEPGDNRDPIRRARGVQDGDLMPTCSLPSSDDGADEFVAPAVTLSLEPMELGLGSRYGPSWRERMMALTTRLGPFKLAWLELLLRVADRRASGLAEFQVAPDLSPDDLAGKHQPLAQVAGEAQVANPVGSNPAGCGPEHGLRTGAGDAGDNPRSTHADRATRYIETTRGVLSYAELAPLLAERVALVEADIYREIFASAALDEALILDLHRRISTDLVPEWAGRWRTVEVQVGSLNPPPPHDVPLRMRDYALDLQARWDAAAAEVSDLTLELLAFAEGRFLTIHPFRDFNGRTIRLFLLELLRRIDLPRVVLAPEPESERRRYFAALEAADRSDWRPLMDIWRERFTSAQTT